MDIEQQYKDLENRMTKVETMIQQSLCHHTFRRQKVQSYFSGKEGNICVCCICKLEIVEGFDTLNDAPKIENPKYLILESHHGELCAKIPSQFDERKDLMEKESFPDYYHSLSGIMTFFGLQHGDSFIITKKEKSDDSV